MLAVVFTKSVTRKGGSPNSPSATQGRPDTVRAATMTIPSPKLNRTTSATCAALAVVLLAGCGAGSRDKVVARACGRARAGSALKLVLSDVLPTPRAQASQGSYVEVVSSYHGNQMTFPAPHPSNAVCEISKQREPEGTAKVVYKALRPGTVTFSSSYTHVTQAAMPAMLGRLVVTR